jgi:hypothetical protein
MQDKLTNNFDRMYKRCERCGTQAFIIIMSQFNTDELCMSCKDIEKQHPKYEEACEAERREIAKGNFNYVGIGLPDDFKQTQVRKTAQSSEDIS